MFGGWNAASYLFSQASIVVGKGRYMPAPQIFSRSH